MAATTVEVAEGVTFDLKNFALIIQLRYIIKTIIAVRKFFIKH